MQRGEACVVGRVCLEEIRKIKTELRGEKPAFVANIPLCVLIRGQEVFLRRCLLPFAFCLMQRHEHNKPVKASAASVGA